MVRRHRASIVSSTHIHIGSMSAPASRGGRASEDCMLGPGIPLRAGLQDQTRNNMSKNRDSKKETKKAPLKSAKEKRQAKQAAKAR
jgi:hypothetical protein